MKTPQKKFEMAPNVAESSRVASPIGNRQSAIGNSKAFTLIEMITVLTIIIIVLAIAIPVWDALMGGTNLAAAQNQISAFIAGARADAIYNRQVMGVCFFTDPKTKQTAMAEVQVQNLYQPHPYGGGTGSPPPYTSVFQPITWISANSWFSPSWTANVYPPAPAPASTTNDNGPVYSLELANYPDPSNPGSFVFYRDVVILPKGVGVVLTNNTFTYNGNSLWNYNPIIPNASSGYPALDRYVHFGVILFAADGTLTTVPYGVPYYECLTLAAYTNAMKTPTFPPENFLCKRLGMYAATDLSSNLYPPQINPPFPQIHLPLISSVGLVIYDHDVYLTQHATLRTVNDNTNYNPTSPAAPVATTIGDNAQFNDQDMNISLTNPGSAFDLTTTSPFAQDKYIEESWIDANGSTFLVTPTSGSLIKAK